MALAALRPSAAALKAQFHGEAVRHVSPLHTEAATHLRRSPGLSVYAEFCEHPISE